MLAGYTRMTYSLVVVVMETTQSINIFIPVVISIMTANFWGNLFTRGLYDRAVRGKQMPILTDQMHESNTYIRAEEIMSSDTRSVNIVESVKNIYDILKTSHHGFPVVNSTGRVVGLIPKNFLVILIQNKNFYGGKMTQNGSKSKKANSI